MCENNDDDRLVIDLDFNNNEKYLDIRPKISVCKEIYLRGKKRLNIEICLKLEELVNCGKLDLTEFDENFMNVMKDMNEKNIHLFDEFEREQLNFNTSYQDKKYFNAQNLLAFIEKSKNLKHKPVDGIDASLQSSKKNKFDFQLYVGNITPDIDLNELKKLFENYGNLNYFNFNKTDQNTSQKRNYGFVGYADYNEGLNATLNLNGYEIITKVKLRVHPSENQAKRVFIDNLPDNWEVKRIEEEFSKRFKGITKVLAYPCEFPNNSYKQNLKCYLEFSDKEYAREARDKINSKLINSLLNGENYLEESSDCNNNTTKLDPYNETRKLFLKKLHSSIGEREIYNYFVKYGQILHITRKNDYAFVEYANESDALTAMHKTDQSFLGPNKITVVLARHDRFATKNVDKLLKMKNQNTYESEPMLQSTPFKRKSIIDKNNESYNKKFKNESIEDKENDNFVPNTKTIIKNNENFESIGNKSYSQIPISNQVDNLSWD
ncbi:unnamed protein product [Brachionus calyciflorus]|uniref:RRM domain-containing protein n=1 Tax=Brachionus calyciflorus TaxID=104777 RepID=A0A813YV00_9BILA|nr:unnamed protein product [Brachionus calyciflorus]